MSTVQLGYIGKVYQKVDEWYYKILGKPELFGEDLSPKCSNCDSELIFILQIDGATTIIGNRGLYVFTCLQKGCIEMNKFWKVFRCQKRADKIKPIVAQKTEKEEMVWFDDQDDWGDSATLGEKSSDKKEEIESIPDTDMCMADDENMDVTQYGVDTELNSMMESLNVEKGKYTEDENTFQGFFLDVYEEEICVKTNDKKYQTVEQYQKENNLMFLDCAKQACKDEYEKTTAYGDRVAEKYINTLRSNPKQIYRYNLSGNPLHISSKAATDYAPNNCNYCGSISLYEFQLMPELCKYLNVEQGMNVDFGTILVSTCSNSCWNNSNKETICEEQVTVQLDPESELIEKMFKSTGACK